MNNKEERYFSIADTIETIVNAESVLFNEEQYPPDDDQVILYKENELASLFSRKKFTSWEACETFINKWAKVQGFHIVKDQVVRENGVLRRRTFICNHSRTYNFSSNKDTNTNKMQCPFY
ncbi:10775_t:CDS:2 [Funneliformis caledonium]|uniref:10775_t:CDS:1 n=1 Tax=Funneliformis caledonium TaxID=1117310 RepID=A0A9N8WGU9_9GLOM|nr:10775_t:CDS:2 [Funneliformis caledonium]